MPNITYRFDASMDTAAFQRVSEAAEAAVAKRRQIEADDLLELERALNRSLWRAILHWVKR